MGGLRGRRPRRVRASRARGAVGARRAAVWLLADDRRAGRGARAADGRGARCGAAARPALPARAGLGRLVGGDAGTRVLRLVTEPVAVGVALDVGVEQQLTTRSGRPGAGSVVVEG